MSIRRLKLRAWLKTRTNTFLRAARAPVLTIIVGPEHPSYAPLVASLKAPEHEPEPPTFDAWVCEHCDPEELFDGLDRQALRRIQQASAASDAPDLYDPLDHATRLRIAGLL